MPDCLWCGDPIEGAPVFYPVSETVFFPGTFCCPPCAKSAMMERQVPKFYSLFFLVHGKVNNAPARHLLERYGGKITRETFIDWRKRNTVTHPSNVRYPGTVLFESLPTVTELAPESDPSVPLDPDESEEDDEVPMDEDD